MNQIKENDLSLKILISMVIGILLGVVIHIYDLNIENSFVNVYVVNGLFKVLGEAFILLLKMLVVPLVFFSLLSGVINIGSIKMLGRIGVKAFFLYIFTTAMAISTALVFVIFFSYGEKTVDLSLHDKLKTIEQAPPFTDILTNIIPENIVMAFSKGEMLPIIFFSVFFAVAYLLLNKKNSNIEEAIDVINETIMKMVYLVTQIAPIAVFALIAKPIAELGIDHLVNLSGYIGVLIAALLFHLLISLMVLLKVTTGLSPRVFLGKMRETQFFAFSTASSNATMPSTLKTLREKMGVDNSVASFTVPFGATINMDGTAIMQGVATVFIANAYGMPLAMTDYLLIIGMSVLASIGTAGVPGVGLIMLSMVFVKLGLPPESIALLMSVDRLLDMIRTTVNVTGDAVVTCIVAKREGKLDESVYYNFRAGVSDKELTDTKAKQIFESMLKSSKYEFEIDDDGKQGIIRLKEDKK